MPCQCHKLENSEFQLKFECQGTKAKPYITPKAMQYIGNTWPLTHDTLVYLLCEEMHYQCMQVKRKYNNPNETCWISRFIACRMHGKIMLTTPVSYTYSKVAGIPFDEYSIVEVPEGMTD